MGQFIGFIILAVALAGVALLATVPWLVSRVRRLSRTAEEVVALRGRVEHLEQQLATEGPARKASEEISPAVAQAGAAPLAPFLDAQPDPAMVRSQPSSVPLVPAAHLEALRPPQVDDALRDLIPPVLAELGPELATEPRPAHAEAPAVVAAPPKPRLSLEERLGHNWLTKLGVITLVIGLVLFLGYQVRTLGPAGKSALGLALSAVLLGGGLWLERRPQYRRFARAGIGGGWALLFFVTFALYHLEATKVLRSEGVDLVLMMAVAIGMVTHSLHYRSQVVTSLAFLLAFVTVGISHLTLFSLVAGALLAAGLVWVAGRQLWFSLALAGMVGAYLNHLLWLQRVLPGGGHRGRPFPDFVASAALLLLYWLLFRLLYVLRPPETAGQRTLSSLTAVLNSAALLSLLKFQSSHPEWAFGGLLALGTAEMALALVGRRRWRGSFVVLSTIASALLLAAIPLRFGHGTWTLLWLLEAEILLLVGLRAHEAVFRRLGLLATLLTALQAVLRDGSLIFDLRHGYPDPGHHSYSVLVLAIALTAAMLWFNGEFAPRRWRDAFAPNMERILARFSSFGAALLLAVALWAMLPPFWTAVAWLAATIAVGWVADCLGSGQLAAEADGLALAALLRLLLVNFAVGPHLGRLSLRAVTLSLAVALLYIGMRRSTRAFAVARSYIGPAYSWTASTLLGGLLWYELRPVNVAVGWCLLALVLFQIGATSRLRYLRHQAYGLIALSFVRLFFANLNGAAQGTHFGPAVYTVVPILAVFAWIYEHATTLPDADRLDRSAAVLPCFRLFAVTRQHRINRAGRRNIALQYGGAHLLVDAF